MKREEFINRIKESGAKTNNDRVLIEAMNFISEYAKVISDALQNSEIDSDEFIAVGNDSKAWIGDKNYQLFFRREPDHIELEVRQPNPPFEILHTDRLIIHSDVVQSEKYGIQMSEDLLDKYLDLIPK